ncbi:MAG: DNA-binding protein [Erysipelotrichaceae bacterium]|nr:DNA-binding protein [Erysipelotrichaceae bacterium]
MDQKFITINHLDLFDSTEFIKTGDQITLKKDLNNPYDDEAIVVKSASGIKIGYVANSVCTVARGTYSAGRIYDQIDEEAEGRICFVLEESAIASVKASQ